MFTVPCLCTRRAALHSLGGLGCSCINDTASHAGERGPYQRPQGRVQTCPCSSALRAARSACTATCVDAACTTGTSPLVAALWHMQPAAEPAWRTNGLLCGSDDHAMHPGSGMWWLAVHFWLILCAGAAEATRAPCTGRASTSLLQLASCTWQAGLSAAVRPMHMHM